MSFKELLKVDKPREKLRQKGAEALADEELLALILRSGVKKHDVIQLGKQLQTLWQQEPERFTLKSLVQLPGVGQAKAASLLAALELGRRWLKSVKTQVRISKPEDALPFLQDLRKERRECLKVLFLDTKNEVLHDELVSVGTLNYSLVHPREIFYPAIKYSAVGIILAHNHPSGSLAPSSDDIKLTEKLMAAGKLLGINLLDHIIISKNDWLSLKSEGHM